VLEIDRLATGSVWTGRGAITFGDRVRMHWDVPVVAAGALAAALTGGLVSGARVPHPTAQAALVAGTVAGFTFAGVFWLRRRPASPYGLCLLLLAACSAVSSLQYAASTELYTVGVLARAPFLAVALFCLLAFPVGWIRGRWTRRLMWFGSAGLLIGVVPALLFTRGGASMQAMGGCGAHCESLQIASAPGPLAALLEALDRVAPPLVALAACGVLVQRFVTGTHAERRSLRWMATFAAAAAGLFGVRWFVVVMIGVPVAQAEPLRWANGIVWAVLPWVMIASLVQAQIFARSALDELLGRLTARPGAPAWEHDVGAALDDPGLRLAFWSPSDQSYRGVRGEPIEKSESEAATAWYEIERDGHPVAAIMHDPALDAEPELLRAAAEATLLSIDNRHLEEDIQAARASALATAEEERRRLERDLHDGAQQHLIALRIKLGLIMELGEPPAELLAELCDEVDAALDELRRLAQGVYPSLLRTDGLASALSAVARRAPVPAAVRTSGVGRHPPEIESAVYFCCLEALQNAAKHAGPGADVTIRVSESDAVLRFAVEDSGAGFDTQLGGGGVGLANMAARTAAVGGTLHIVSAPGHGTSVNGRIELPAGPTS